MNNRLVVQVGYCQSCLQCYSGTGAPGKQTGCSISRISRKLQGAITSENRISMRLTCFPCKNTPTYRFDHVSQRRSDMLQHQRETAVRLQRRGAHQLHNVRMAQGGHNTCLLLQQAGERGGRCTESGVGARTRCAGVAAVAGMLDDHNGPTVPCRMDGVPAGRRHFDPTARGTGVGTGPACLR